MQVGASVVFWFWILPWKMKIWKIYLNFKKLSKTKSRVGTSYRLLRRQYPKTYFNNVFFGLAGSRLSLAKVSDRRSDLIKDCGRARRARSRKMGVRERSPRENFWTPLMAAEKCWISSMKHSLEMDVGIYWKINIEFREFVTFFMLIQILFQNSLILHITIEKNWFSRLNIFHIN